MHCWESSVCLTPGDGRWASLKLQGRQLCPALSNRSASILLGSLYQSYLRKIILLKRIVIRIESWTFNRIVSWVNRGMPSCNVLTHCGWSDIHTVQDTQTMVTLNFMNISESARKLFHIGQKVFDYPTTLFSSSAGLASFIIKRAIFGPKSWNKYG